LKQVSVYDSYFAKVKTIFEHCIAWYNFFEFNFQHSCRALGNWLFCKTLVAGRLVRFCKCANMWRAKIIF